MTGMLLPSTTLTYFATRWGHRNRELRVVRAFKQGMAPIVVGLLLATGWVLVRGGIETTFNAADPRGSAGVDAHRVADARAPAVATGCGSAVGWLGAV